MTRRNILQLAGVAAGLAGPRTAPSQDLDERLGIGASSYGIRRRHDRETGAANPINHAGAFLDYCHSLGTGGIQTSLSAYDPSSARRLRKKAEEYGMYVEASVALPRDPSDLAAFKRAVRTAKNAGARVIRTVMLGGRRYETFHSQEAFDEFARGAWTSLTLAEPIVRQRQMKLAIENHKDWRIGDLLGLMKRISSEYIGICVDTGNNIALLEDPNAVAEAFAPYAYSVHLKDMAVEPYQDGFLLSEVPLGRGMLDLPRIVQTLRQARPRIHFTLEMITRDPLTIPCLTENYWTTFSNLPGGDLARTLVMVRERKHPVPLPRVSQLSMAERVKVEDDNVRKSQAYARDNLGL